MDIWVRYMGHNWPIFLLKYNIFHSKITGICFTLFYILHQFLFLAVLLHSLLLDLIFCVLHLPSSSCSSVLLWGHSAQGCISCCGVSSFVSNLGRSGVYGEEVWSPKSVCLLVLPVGEMTPCDLLHYHYL